MVERREELAHFGDFHGLAEVAKEVSKLLDVHGVAAILVIAKEEGADQNADVVHENGGIFEETAVTFGAFHSAVSLRGRRREERVRRFRWR